MVYTTGHGVNGFTLDPSLGEFLLSHEHIKIPKRGKIYSINEGNINQWDAGTRRYIEHVKQDQKADGRPYSLRYIGSLVADFHRNLLKGGIFLYPGPKGKLRLLYEAAPLAWWWNKQAARRPPEASASSTSCRRRSTKEYRSSSAARTTFDSTRNSAGNRLLQRRQRLSL